MTAPGQQAWVRGDAAFATAKNVAAAIKAGAWLSFTIPAWPTVAKAISQIPEDGWTPIEYPNAIWDDETQAWSSEAEIAETEFTAFVSHPKAEQAAAPTRRTTREATGGRTCHRSGRTVHHLPPPRVHQQHHLVRGGGRPVPPRSRDRRAGHAELKAGPLARLPSGTFAANAAWLAFAVMAFNICRAAAVAAGTGKARTATMLRTIIAIPARLAATGGG